MLRGWRKRGTLRWEETAGMVCLAARCGHVPHFTQQALHPPLLFPPCASSSLSLLPSVCHSALPPVSVYHPPLTPPFCV